MQLLECRFIETAKIDLQIDGFKYVAFASLTEKLFKIHDKYVKERKQIKKCRSQIGLKLKGKTQLNNYNAIKKENVLLKNLGNGG